MLPQTYLCLFVWCKACHHQAAADLQAIIDAGKGDRPLKDLKFRVCLDLSSNQQNSPEYLMVNAKGRVPSR